MVKVALAAVCGFTLLATAYLTASVLILRPPRANYQQWALVASVIVAQGTLTLFALYSAYAKTLRYLLVGGGCVLAYMGGQALYDTMFGLHFEGYALLLGLGMVLEGLLTLPAFLRQGQVSDTV
jgi:hypothetical protein